MRQLELFGFTEDAPVKKREPQQELLVEETRLPLTAVPPSAGEDAGATTTENTQSSSNTNDSHHYQPAPADHVIEFDAPLFAGEEAPVTKKPLRKSIAPAKGRRGRKSFKEIDAEIALVEVPGDEELQQKMYYPISQVAQWFNVNTSLIRFWENEFDILKPRKNRKGDRMFRPEDVKNLQVIYYLLRQRKFSIEGAKKYIKQNKSRADVNIQLIQSLTKFRSFLLELKANLGA
ncbi:MAG TPA: MerR family transcriptional regulator [Chitinophagaceae bacterium]|nr:MerR family transcriptional regulator [Chitinophagaceae bacterium]